MDSLHHIIKICINKNSFILNLIKFKEGFLFKKQCINPHFSMQEIIQFNVEDRFLQEIAWDKELMLKV